VPVFVVRESLLWNPKTSATKRTMIANLPPPSALERSVNPHPQKRRLQRIANYESFRPQALACSRLRLPSSPRDATPSASPEVPASLGAIAGPEGMAVFHWTQPQVPVLLLPHVTTAMSGGGCGLTTLAFSPPSSSERYLAAARGAGLLVWDVTGHSLSPLQGRFGMRSSSPNSSNLLTSMTWCSAQSIAATTSFSAGLWDVRQAGDRPSRRFAEASGTAAPYRQIACSMEDSDTDRPQCAILDAAGVVRLYDARMTTDRVDARRTAFRQFQAHHGTGIGLSAMPIQNDGRGHTNGWVTWGLDATLNTTDAVVKVWMPMQDPGEYRLMGQCTSHHLACARVCPVVDNALVTVRFAMQSSAAEGEYGPSVVTGWKADVWKLQFHDLPSDNATDRNSELEYGDSVESTLERVVSFRGPSDAPDEDLSSVLGSREMKKLLAADVTLSDDNNDLILCCLTENGFVTTHVRLLFPCIVSICDSWFLWLPLCWHCCIGHSRNTDGSTPGPDVSPG
jgi:hypothetical protein